MLTKQYLATHHFSLQKLLINSLSCTGLMHAGRGDQDEVQLIISCDIITQGNFYQTSCVKVLTKTWHNTVLLIESVWFAATKLYSSAGLTWLAAQQTPVDCYTQFTHNCNTFFPDIACSPDISFICWQCLLSYTRLFSLAQVRLPYLNLRAIVLCVSRRRLRKIHSRVCVRLADRPSSGYHVRTCAGKSKLMQRIQ